MARQSPVRRTGVFFYTCVYMIYDFVLILSLSWEIKSSFVSIRNDWATNPAAARLPHAGFFMPMGPSYDGWEDLKAETVAAVAEGRLRVMLDEGSAGHIGLEGVYEAQARMRLGVNSGKIYAVIDEALCRGERASL